MYIPQRDTSIFLSPEFYLFLFWHASSDDIYGNILAFTCLKHSTCLEVENPFVCCRNIIHYFYKGPHRIGVAISIFCVTMSAPVVAGRELWLTSKIAAESIQVSSGIMNKDIRVIRKVTRDGLE